MHLRRPLMQRENLDLSLVSYQPQETHDLPQSMLDHEEEIAHEGHC